MPVRKPLLERKRRPSELVKTVNLLARVKGEIAKTDEQCQRLSAALVPLRKKLDEAQQQFDLAYAAESRAAQHQAELEQLVDVLQAKLRAIDPRLDGSATQPVRSVGDRYGSYGGLRRTLLGLLAADGGWVPTPRLGHAVAAALGLVFDTPELANKWRTDTVGGTLRELLAEGKVERYKPGDVQAEVFWRLKVDQAAKTLEELKARVEALMQIPSGVSAEDASKAG